MRFEAGVGIFSHFQMSMVQCMTITWHISSCFFQTKYMIASYFNFVDYFCKFHRFCFNLSVSLKKFWSVLCFRQKSKLVWDNLVALHFSFFSFTLRRIIWRPSDLSSRGFTSLATMIYWTSCHRAGIQMLCRWVCMDHKIDHEDLSYNVNDFEQHIIIISRRLRISILHLV